jgi:hypothetical protein
MTTDLIRTPEMAADLQRASEVAAHQMGAVKVTQDQRVLWARLRLQDIDEDVFYAKGHTTISLVRRGSALRVGIVAFPDKTEC